MIDATYLYHRDSDSLSVSTYNYVPFQNQQVVSHEDIAFHENAMGPVSARNCSQTTKEQANTIS